MRRQQSNALNALSNQKSKRYQESENIHHERCDLTLDDLPYLGSDSWYHYKHIAGVAKGLCKKHGVNFGQQFEIVGSTEQLTNFLKKTDPAHVSENPLFLIYSVNNSHWVTFCVTHCPEGVIVLYKDSLGGDIPNEIRETIQERYHLATFVVSRAKEQVDGYNCGPMALRNMEIIMEIWKKNHQGLITNYKEQLVASYNEWLQANFKERLVAKLNEWLICLYVFLFICYQITFNDYDDCKFHEIIMTVKNEVVCWFTHCTNLFFFGSKTGCKADFETKLFCSTKQIKPAKDEFRKLVGEEIVETCLKLASEMSKVDKFKLAAEKLVESCVRCIEMVKDVEEYVESFHDEANKNKENSDYGVNVENLKMKKRQIEMNPQIKLWSDQIQRNINNGEILSQHTDLSDSDNAEIKTEIEVNYPETSQKLKHVFLLLGLTTESEVHTVRAIALRKICEILDLDVNKLQLFYDVKFALPAVNSQLTKCEEVLANSIDEINRQLSEVKLSQPSYSSQGKTSEQVLAELAIGQINEEVIAELTDKETQEFYQKIYQENVEILGLKRQYDDVKKHYENWKGKSIKEIAAWGRKNKRRLLADCLCEAVAVLDRANELVTRGHFLRDTQILAVLDSLNCTDRKGKLCQIATGEGKTVIVSLIAAIKVLQGKQVDVITSNEVLAEEGVNTRGNFFGVLGISVAHNNPDEKYRRGPRKCYTADVVYGSMGSFQFDYLKDSFEGLETRGSRKFGFVILDEVDSLLLDNGGHVAKLGEQFPGFDSLQYVYIKIWQELAKAEEEIIGECEERLRKKSEKLIKNEKNMSDEEMNVGWQSLVTKIFHNISENMVARIKKSDPANIDLIPVHLREFARDMVDSWVKNAIYAKYSCHENEQYVVRKLGDASEPKIVPVDYQGTGVTLKNTMWSNGLHQFVQLKHNLQLTSETMTSSLISNIGYVKLYDNNIFGLTGTLGSTAEQKLLSSVYTLDYSSIPTFKPKRFKEFDGIVVRDKTLKERIANDSLKLIDNKRSVLIICNTINDALAVKEKILKIHSQCSQKISTYFDESSSEVVQQVIDVGEIIISTNIAGRGSDFKTTSELEANGGLHVLVCFLPVNQRVEDQAFGRTSRQGNKGTAQIVMRESEVQGLGFATVKDLPFKEIKDLRDELEADRLERIRKVELVEIDFQDRIFGLFSILYRKVMKAEKKQPSIFYLLKDLKEFWSVWLHKKQKENVAIANVDEEFEKFKHAARSILGEEKDGTFDGGRISHNPYYSIQQAVYFLENDFFDLAEYSLTDAISISGDFSKLLYPAHLRMYEVSIEQGYSVMNRFVEALKTLIFFGEDEKPREYLKKALESLKMAKTGLEREAEYITKNFTGNNLKDDETIHNQDFIKILTHSSDNLLLKQIWSRFKYVKTLLDNVNGQLSMVEESIQCKKDIFFKSKISKFLNAEQTPNGENKDQTQNGEKREQTPIRENKDQTQNGEKREQTPNGDIVECPTQGNGTVFYELGALLNVSFDCFAPGLIQIGIGILTLGPGLFFPPLLFIFAKIAEVFITEGVTDIISVLITGPSPFDIMDKLLSYGVSVFTSVVFNLFKYRNIAQRAINICQRLINSIERNPILNAMFKRLIPLLEKAIQALNKVIIAQREIITMGAAIKRISTNVAKKACAQVVNNHVYHKVINKCLPDLESQISFNQIMMRINCDENREILRHVERDCVTKLTSDSLLSPELKMYYKFKKTADKLYKKFKLKMNVHLLVKGGEEAVDKLVVFEALCYELGEWLKEIPRMEGTCNSEKEVDEMLKALAHKLSKYVWGDLIKSLRNKLTTYITKKIPSRFLCSLAI